MTNKELIEKLYMYPEDATIIIDDDGFLTIFDIGIKYHENLNIIEIW